MRHLSSPDGAASAVLSTWRLPKACPEELYRDTWFQLFGHFSCAFVDCAAKLCVQVRAGGCGRTFREIPKWKFALAVVNAREDGRAIVVFLGIRFNELGRVQNLGKIEPSIFIHPRETSVLTLGKMHKHLTFLSQIWIAETTTVFWSLMTIFLANFLTENEER